MTITFGNQLQVDTIGTATYTVQLTSSTAICFYSDFTDAVSAKHLTLSGDTLSAGAKITIDSTNTPSTRIKAAKLTSTAVLLVYQYGSTHNTRVITVSGTTLTANAITGLTDKNILNNFISPISSSAALYCYSDSSNNGKAVILSVSGTTVTENSIFTFDANCRQVCCSALSSTKGAVAFSDLSNSGYMTSEVLDIAGTTITGNADNVFGTRPSSVATNKSSMYMIDSIHVFVSWGESFLGTAYINGVILTESGGNLSDGVAAQTSPPTEGSSLSAAVLTSTGAVTILANPGAASVVAFYEWGISGTSVSFVGTQTKSATGPFGVSIATLTDGQGIASWDSTTEAIPLSLPIVSNLSLASMTKPADIDAAGGYIYLALLDGGTPILTKIATDLTADGTTVFDPGSGDNIGVQCGKFNANVVWVAGNFGGTDTVEKSEDAGASFSVKDPGTFDPVTSFVVGPDSDDRVLVITDVAGSAVSGSIQETTDSGATWDEKDSGLGFVSKAVGRLDINVEELVTGNEAGANDNIHYSPNTGEDQEDYSTGFPTQDVTGVIVG